MRERLTAAFIVLTIVLLLGAGAVRTFVMRDLLREQEARHLTHESELIASAIEARLDDAGPVDRKFLDSLVGSDERLEYDGPGSDTIVVRGPDYTGSDDPADDLSASSATDGVMVTVSEAGERIADNIQRSIGSVIALFLLVGATAGLAGFLIASAMSAPFMRLAEAAGALGRGRFDLDLPKTRIPEARAISTALSSSAHQLEERLLRERSFAEHASHVLRTPLTSLRLELEDLTLRDDVPDDVRTSAARSLASVEQIDAVATELVELTRQGSLVAGAELTLADLSTQLAQRWADRLTVRNRALTAAVDGDLDLTFTPGPVEYVTDLLLADVVRRSSGPVRLVFHGEEAGHLRIHVECEAALPEQPADGERFDRIAEVRSVTEALGGRVTGDHPGTGLDVLLPRR